VATVTNDSAPDFTPGFPSSGQRIGPAWSLAWRLLAGGGWVDSRPLWDACKLAGILIAHNTMKNLLYRAERKGLLEKRIQPNAARTARTVVYRRVAGKG
jgi:hypothetical protein